MQQTDNKNKRRKEKQTQQISALEVIFWCYVLLYRFTFYLDTYLLTDNVLNAKQRHS